MQGGCSRLLEGGGGSGGVAEEEEEEEVTSYSSYSACDMIFERFLTTFLYFGCIHSLSTATTTANKCMVSHALWSPSALEDGGGVRLGLAGCRGVRVHTNSTDLELAPTSHQVKQKTIA